MTIYNFTHPSNIQQPPDKKNLYNFVSDVATNLNWFEYLCPEHSVIMVKNIISLHSLASMYNPVCRKRKHDAYELLIFKTVVMNIIKKTLHFD
jgi:hypothetical protein